MFSPRRELGRDEGHVCIMEFLFLIFFGLANKFVAQANNSLPMHERSIASPELGRNSIAASEFSSPSTNVQMDVHEDGQARWSPIVAESGRTQPDPHHDDYAAENRSVSMTLDNSMMRTVVSSGNDALNILFEAATVRENRRNSTGNTDSLSRREQNARTNSHEGNTGIAGNQEHLLATPRPSISMANAPERLSNPGEQVLRIWETCRFVRMGWFAAREAITYIDLLAKHLSLILYVSY